MYNVTHKIFKLFSRDLTFINKKNIHADNIFLIILISQG